MREPCFQAPVPLCPLQGREKINLIHSFTQLGFDVLISDVDTVWLRNPIPYVQQARSHVPGPPVLAHPRASNAPGLSLSQYPAADVLTSSDHLVNTLA